MDWKIDLMNTLLDYYIDEYGVDDTICFLMRLGIGHKQILEYRIMEKCIENYQKIFLPF